MAITLRSRPEDILLELGGGANPVLKPRCQGGKDVCIDSRLCYDAEGKQTVDIQADLNEILPLQSDEFDGVFSQYLLEHLSWRKVRQFVQEMSRVLKPGGRCVAVTANTEAQMEFIKSHQGGWDGKDAFDSFSCVLFGDNDYPENSHKNFLSPMIAQQLFAAAGFTNIVISAYGAAQTDMLIQAVKPVVLVPKTMEVKRTGRYVRRVGDIVIDADTPEELEDKTRSAQIEQQIMTGNPDVPKPQGIINVPSRLGNTTDPVAVMAESQQWSVLASETFSPMTPADSLAQLSEQDKIRQKAHEDEIREKHGQDIEIVWDKINPHTFAARYRKQQQIKAGDIVQLVHKIEAAQSKPPSETAQLMATPEGRQLVFGKDYFNGGKRFGGYMREGMWDYPCHELTARHVLARKPSSVLELGAARGYILKRIQNTGILAWGMEISKHCIMTRVHDRVFQHDTCQTPWRIGNANASTIIKDGEIDLCVSIAVMEHIPEQFLPAVIGEMQRTCKRGLHGIDFGGRDDGADRSHVSLHEKSWWDAMFAKYAPGWPVEILDKEELERGDFPPEVLRGDGRIKLNIGSFTVMHHYGWQNIDVNDLIGFAQAYKYNFTRCDVRQGLPYGTGVVDCIVSNHCLEHLTYEEGLAFLRECRRVIRPDGAIRIVVPDAGLLMGLYADGAADMGGPLGLLSEFDEISDGAAARTTPLGKLWELLQGQDHRCWYDGETLSSMFQEAAFKPLIACPFHTEGNERSRQIVAEAVDMFPVISLVADGLPIIG